MMMAIRADEVQAGDVIDGREVMAVNVSAGVTIIEFSLSENKSFLNDTEVLVERSIFVPAWVPSKTYHSLVPGNFMDGSLLPDDTREPVEAPTKPAGEWVGPCHCLQCARWIWLCGFTEKHAWEATHGSPDVKFGATCGDM